MPFKLFWNFLPFKRVRRFTSALHPSTYFYYATGLEVSSTITPNGASEMEEVIVYHPTLHMRVALRIKNDGQLWRDPVCHVPELPITVAKSAKVAIPGIAEDVWYVEGYTPPRKGSTAYGIFFGLSSYKPLFGQTGAVTACPMPIYLGVSGANQQAPFQILFTFEMQSIDSPFTDKHQIKDFFATNTGYKVLKDAILSVHY